MAQPQYQQDVGNPYGREPASQGYVTGQGQNAPLPTMSHEMSNYSQASAYSTQAALPFYSILDFLSRVDKVKESIRALTRNITEIATLHQSTLSSTSSSSPATLEGLVTDTQILNAQIRDQIKALGADAEKTPSEGTSGARGTKYRQIQTLKNSFDAELKSYQQEELNYRQRYREQIARQYRIVNPEATDAEVQEASYADWGNEGIFQAALKSNRTGAASSTLNAVRARHNELQAIESTLVELSTLFQDMAEIVERDEQAIVNTEANAEKSRTDVEKAVDNLAEANKSARSRNKYKRWCFFIAVIIVLCIALGVGLGVGLVNKNK